MRGFDSIKIQTISLIRRKIMKNYTITVNGQTYAVQVEEGITAAAQSAPVVTIPAAPVYTAPVAAPAPVAAAPAPVAAPAPAPVPAADPAPAPAAAAPSGSAGSITVESPMPGKILSIEAAVGDSVAAGQTIMILEAMKMENEIVAPEAGTIASLNVTVNQAVEAGEVLATLN